ncbi:hypothetical protein ACPV5O_16730 [Vibrio maritimus]|uniref:hypothetical protein n=1 Tax=Vibrio maritimus TaxID=990268 RepID=UPI004067E54F
MELTLKYAFFRHKNQTKGRTIESLVIALAIISMSVLVTANELYLILPALITTFFCVGAFWFFRRAEEIRRSMPQ